MRFKHKNDYWTLHYRRKRPYKTKITVNINPKIIDDLKRLADKENISLETLVNNILDSYLKK